MSLLLEHTNFTRLVLMSVPADIASVLRNLYSPFDSVMKFTIALSSILNVNALWTKLLTPNITATTTVTAMPMSIS